MVVRLAGADCTVRLLESEDKEDFVFRAGRFFAWERFRLPVLVRGAVAGGGLEGSVAVGSGVGPGLRAPLLSDAFLGCFDLPDALLAAAAAAIGPVDAGVGGSTILGMSGAVFPFC